MSLARACACSTVRLDNNFSLLHPCRALIQSFAERWHSARVGVSGRSIQSAAPRWRAALVQPPQEPGMADSTQKKLERVRPPRVAISYEVDTGGAIEKKELPFLMGVLGDFSGQPTSALPKLKTKERKFVEVTPDNFDETLASMKPHLAFTVDNKLSDDPSKARLKVDLHFRSLEDFSPEGVAKQVKPLQELLALRSQLADLRGSLQTNDRLDEVLQETLGDADKMNRLRGELGLTESANPEGGNG
jgi:type VI secretion system protein ImpB